MTRYSGTHFVQSNRSLPLTLGLQRLSRFLLRAETYFPKSLADGYEFNASTSMRAGDLRGGKKRRNRAIFTMSAYERVETCGGLDTQSNRQDLRHGPGGHEYARRQLHAPRFPPPIIAHAVWLYFRFPLSLRLVEEMLLERGIVVSYETSRRWGIKFGLDCARCLRRKPPCRNDVWYLNEVVVTIARQKALVVARRRPGWICAGRNRAKPPQHQGRQALADAAVEEAGARAEAHDHLLAALVWSGKATGDAGRQAPVAQGVEQRSGEFPCAAAKTERMMQGSDRREACNASSRPCQPSATSSSRPAPNVLLSPYMFIASARWRW